MNYFTHIILFLFLTYSGQNVYAQTIQAVAPYSLSISNTNEDKIRAVYGNNFASENPGMHRHMLDLLSDRVRFVNEIQTADEKYKSLSSVGILNKNNPSLTHDSTFDPTTFNVLKYNLNFYSKTTQIYRFDNSDVLIVIDPM